MGTDTTASTAPAASPSSTEDPEALTVLTAMSGRARR